jgi:hypothetical protein
VYWLVGYLDVEGGPVQAREVGKSWRERWRETLSLDICSAVTEGFDLYRDNNAPLSPGSSPEGHISPRRFAAEHLGWTALLGGVWTLETGREAAQTIPVTGAIDKLKKTSWSN